MRDAPGKTGKNMYANKAFLVEAIRLKEIKCACCGGYGHHVKICPTRAKIRKAQIPGSLSFRWMRQALEYEAPTYAQLGLDPALKTALSHK